MKVNVFHLLIEIKKCMLFYLLIRKYIEIV